MTATTYDPGPVPDEKPVHSRAGKIAAIHALAEHLEQHPDFPMPDRLVLAKKITERDEQDEALRVAPVLDFHASHPTSTIYEDREALCVYEELISEEAVGMTITFTYTADINRPARRYTS